MLSAVYDLKTAEKKETKTQPAPETKDTANPIVPVGQRQPAVVEARPLATVPESREASDSDELPDDVVAVIMAAVAACRYGYSPAAIRSIRLSHRGYKTPSGNWPWQPAVQVNVKEKVLNQEDTDMKKFKITVNGKSYEVEVEEVGGATPAAPVAPAPAAPAPAAPAPTPAPTRQHGTISGSAVGARSRTVPSPSRLRCRARFRRQSGSRNPAVKRGDVLVLKP